MLAILQPEDWATWLGEREGSPGDIMMVLRTLEDGGNWTMTEQEAMKKASKPRKGNGQPESF